MALTALIVAGWRTYVSPNLRPVGMRHQHAITEDNWRLPEQKTTEDYLPGAVSEPAPGCGLILIRI